MRITYSDDEENIIKSGLNAIAEVLNGTDTEKKLSLLLCLDKYLDPWFGYSLPYRDEIFTLLEQVIVSDDSLDVVDEAMNLLQYGGDPYPVLKENFDKIPAQCRPDAEYYLHEGEKIMNFTELDKYFEKSDLIPAIAVDVNTKQVLMLAYMNRESLKKTLETGYTWYWSRSRQELWNKGATSGHLQKVVSIFADCDNDTLLVNVEQTGNACHTGSYSCFFRQIYGKPEV